MVSDQQKALEFYTKKLGFDVRFNMEFGGVRWIEVAPKSSVSTISLMIPNPDMMSDEEVILAKKAIGKPTGIWFYTNDIQGTFEELKSKGIDITQPEEQQWGGIMCKVKDQDGNSFALISSPTKPEA